MAHSEKNQESAGERTQQQVLEEGTSQSSVSHLSFSQAFWFWLKLGFISFGGPAGQISVMHTELVDRRRWISERRFLHALNYCMILPGPEAQQLATYIGWLLHGTWGGIVSGSLFIIPGMLILVALSSVYVAFGQVPLVEAVFYGMKAAVVAVVAFAVLRIGGRTIKNLATFALAAGAFVAMSVFQVPFPLIVLTAGLLGVVGAKVWPSKFIAAKPHAPSNQGEAAALIDDHHLALRHTKPSLRRFLLHLATGVVLWIIPIFLLVAWQSWQGTFTQMGWFFTQTALVTFGGAYAVLPFVANSAVNHYGWLKAEQMIDGLALGETTPGPLILIVTFVGFVGGWQQGEIGWQGAILGAMVATYFTFLPSFLFILLGAPWIEQMRGELRLTAALTGVTSAVVGVILNLAVFFGREVFWVQGRIDWIAVLMAGTAFMLLSRFKANIVVIVLGCGAIGVVVHLLGVPAH